MSEPVEFEVGRYFFGQPILCPEHELADEDGFVSEQSLRSYKHLEKIDAQVAWDKQLEEHREKNDATSPDTWIRTYGSDDGTR